MDGSEWKIRFEEMDDLRVPPYRNLHIIPVSPVV
jgi:hypothetical protein